MACLTITPGAFTPLGGWQGGNMTVITANGATVKNENTAGGSSLTVSKNGVTKSIISGTINRTHFLVFGTPLNFVLGVLFDGVTASVVVFEITNSGVVDHGLGPTSSSQLPVVSRSAGAGGVFLIVFHSSTSGVAPLLVRSDNGAVLASDPFFTPTGTIRADAVDTAAEPKKLRIIHNDNVIAVADWPVGKSTALPTTINFPDVVIGPGVPANLTTQTKQGKIKNTGNDCLVINGVQNNPPFNVNASSFSLVLPATLQPNQEITFDIIFNPGTTAGSPFIKDLLIIPTPPSGDTKIVCKGKARPPQMTATTNAPINFGSIPVGNSATRNLVISNTGETDLSLIAFPSPSPPVFNWTVPALPAPIPFGSSLTIPITFTPTAEGPTSRAISFSTTASNSPHNISANGSGCIPHAVIGLSANIIDLGSVQKGFRTVRIFKVSNTGNGPLQFDASIEPAVPGDAASIADAGFFGLLEDENTSVVSPLQGFSNKIIQPVTLCGSSSTGSGEVLFGVAFFAGDGAAVPSPRTVNARLVIFNHNDNTPGTPASFSINLTAEINNPVSVDVQLVIDRSGSMSETSGSRIKIDMAKAAARLFIELMRADVDDRLGLIRFNTTPEVIPSFGIQPVTLANRASIRNQINTSNFTPSGATSIAGGVIVAQNDLNNNPRPTPPPLLNKVLLVLTDGKDNTPFLNPADGKTYSLLGGFDGFPPKMTFPLPVPTDMKIYAIGIGDDIDVGKLGQLATSSGGAFLHTKEFSGTDFFNLEKHFTQVYMEAVNFAQISDPVFNILPGETHKFPFEILPGDKSAIVVLYDRDFRLPFWITTPTGEVIDLLSVPAGFQIRPGVSPTARFIEINMPQSEPDRYVGTWQVRVVHDKRACTDERQHDATLPLPNFGPGFQPTSCKPWDKPIMYGIAIGAGSDFNLTAFVTPGIVKIGESILLTAMVAEFGLPVKGCVVDVKAVRPDGAVSTHTLFDDGNHHDDQPDDGTYAVAYPNTFQEGTYTFTFTASGKSRDGKPVRREVVRSKYVEGRNPLVDNNPGNDTGGGKDECCTQVTNWLRTGVVLLLLILIVLILIWKR